MKLLRSRKNLIYAGLVAILSAILAVSSTYAWLGVSRVPYVSDVGVSVIVDNALLIAPDVNGKPGEWSSTLDASEFLSQMAPLRPATYTPEGFKKILFDNTGRTNGVEPLPETSINVKKGFEPEITNDKASWNNFGSIIRLDFWMKCEGATASVNLADAVETADGQMGAGTYVVGAPVWNQQTVRHVNGGHGSETTIRLGFKCTTSDLDGNLYSGQTKFVMYEPNANIHYDGSVGYKETESTNGGPLIDNAHLAIQEASSWNEQDPALQGTVIYKAGKFTQNVNLFDLTTSTMEKVSLYIWMEGQDYDCIAATVADAVSIMGHLQFGTDAEERPTDIVRGNEIDPDREFEVKRY